MKILGIETSCDETAAAVVEANKNNKTLTLLSNVVSTSLTLHAKTGGVIPEIAAREQLKFIVPVIEQALKESDSYPSNANFQLSTLNSQLPTIDAIAVTYGPGLIGSLLVGVETAKTLSYVWNKPLIPVNHLYGHIYANFIGEMSNIKSQISNISIPKFPAIALIVSGGHTDLVLMKRHGSIKWLGGTRDDAAGEAFDKIGRMLDLPYPAGPTIEKLSKKGNPKAYTFPKPMIGSNDFDFSFSGLKTAVYREIQKIKKIDESKAADICSSLQQTIIDILIKKTLKAAEKYNAKSILLGGGVAANQTLRDQLALEIGHWKLEIPLFVPEKRLCTDNAAMIASAAFFNYEEVPWQKLTANPELYFD